MGEGRPRHNDFDELRRQVEILAGGAGAECAGQARARIDVLLQRLEACQSELEARNKGEQIQRSEQLLQSIIDNTPALIYVKGLDGRVIIANDPMAEAVGMPLQAILGRTCREYIANPQDARDHMANDQRVLQSGRACTFEEYSLGRVFLSIKFPLRDDHGCITAICGVSTDITERTRAEEALRASEERLRMALDAAHMGTWDWDLLHDRIIWDDQHYRMMGYQPGTIQPNYRAWANRVHPEDLPGAELLLRQAMEQGLDFQNQYRTLWPDGTVRHLESHGRVERDGDGQAVRCYGVLLDVTAHREADDALHAANVQLAQAGRRKDEFLAMLAHELRNPLAPIRNAVHLLRVEGLSASSLERQRNIIDRQVAHMGRLLDDLLDVSRITRGTIELQRQPLRMTDVLAHAMEMASPLIESRRQALTVALPPGDLCVEADPDRMAQVIGNLLANAAKFTAEGGQIWLEAGREDGSAAVRVRDSGIGIAPEMLPHIFELFVQADRSLARTQGGLGIGLTMVKSLVEMHGGTIEARSPGLCRGSEFILRLPALPALIEADRLAPSSAPPGAAAPEPVSRRVLVVDDIIDTSASLAELLETWGHMVLTAHDGLSALETARRFQPEVVLLDIGMPGLDGFEVARRLRLEYADRLRLVALTGYAQDCDRQRSREAGFDDHLAKPVDLAALKALLAGRLDN